MVPAPERPEGHRPSEAGGARAGRAPAQPGLRGHFGWGTPGDRVERGRSGAPGAATPEGSASPASYLGRQREPCAKGRTRDPTGPGTTPALPGHHRLWAPAQAPRPLRRAGPATPAGESGPRSPPWGADPPGPGPPPPGLGRAPGSPAAPAGDRCAPGCRCVGEVSPRPALPRVLGGAGSRGRAPNCPARPPDLRGAPGAQDGCGRCPRPGAPPAHAARSPPTTPRPPRRAPPEGRGDPVGASPAACVVKTFPFSLPVPLPCGGLCRI